VTSACCSMLATRTFFLNSRSSRCVTPSLPWGELFHSCFLWSKQMIPRLYWLRVPSFRGSPSSPVQARFLGNRRRSALIEPTLSDRVVFLLFSIFAFGETFYLPLRIWDSFWLINTSPPPDSSGEEFPILEGDSLLQIVSCFSRK